MRKNDVYAAEVNDKSRSLCGALGKRTRRNVRARRTISPDRKNQKACGVKRTEALGKEPRPGKAMSLGYSLKDRVLLCGKTTKINKQIVGRKVANSEE